MAGSMPANALGAMVIKTEPTEESESPPSGTEVLNNGSLSADVHGQIYIPSKFPLIKNEPGDVLEGMPGERLLEEDIGDISFEDTELPDCMFECCYCKILFAEPNPLRQHLEEAHSGMEDIGDILDKLTKNTKLYSISTTAKGSPEDNSEDSQIKKQRICKDLRISCDYPGCSKTFVRRGALQTHQIVHDVSKECPHCRLEFKTITALLRHIDRKHNLVKASRVDCTYSGCNKTFRNSQSLKLHQLVHDEDKRCYICGMMFPHVNSLQQHMQGVHATFAFGNISASTKQYVAAAVSLMKHRPSMSQKADGANGSSIDEFAAVEKETCEEPEETQFTCTYRECALEYESQVQLEWHLKYTLHHESQYKDHPFHCPYKVCDVLFQSKDAVCNHMKEEHWGTKKVKIAAAAKLAKESREAQIKPQKVSTQRKCPVCWENFVNVSKMKQHLKKQHLSETEAYVDRAESQILSEPSMETSETEGTPNDAASNDLVFELQMFKCPMCHTSYLTVNRLKYHFQHHHGCETSLNFLDRLKNDSEEFKSIVPATLYGDSFKSRKRKTVSKNQSPKKSPETVGNPMKQTPKKFIIEPGEISPEKLNSHLGESSVISSILLQKSLLETSIEASFESEGAMFAADVSRSGSEYDNETAGLRLELADEDCSKIGNVDGLKKQPNELEDAEKMDADKDFDLDKDGNIDEDFEDEELKEGMEEGADNSGKRGNPMCRYPSCFKKFQNRFELMRHQRTHEKLLKCPHSGCDQGFFNSNNLRLHIQLVHAELQDTKCKDCGIVGKRSYIIYRHPKFCPKTIGLKCPQCAKSFGKISSFTNHVRSHDKKVRRNYHCEYEGCGKQFRTRQDRTRHHNVHSGARPHACPYANCDKTYKQRPHLLVHLKASHTIRKDEDKKTFTCEYCSSVFKHSCGRLKHIRKSCMQGPNKVSIIEHRRQRLGPHSIL